MRQRPANGRHGYVLHNACWCLLEKAFDTEIVPLERLLKVCDSLPFPLRWEGVCWGHDYGGLVLLDDENYYPWEDRLKEQAIDSEIYDYARANPYDIVDISRLRAIPSDCPPNTMLSGQGNDCFKVLPWEILEAIAILLPTKDALILRRASKSFAPIFVSQSFWASKFEPGRERDLIFEKRNCKEPRDWRSLYGSTSRATSVPGLQNRWRIWSLIQLLREPLRLRMGDNLRVLSANMNSINLRWISIAGDVRQELGTGYYARFNEGCRVLYEQYTLVPDNLSKLAFSIIEASDGTYVVGLRLIYDPVMDICLGYIAEGKEIFVDVKVLRGLVVAIGPRGIRALQVINGEKTRSRWLGCPRNSPITERLRGSGSTAALKVGFDVSLLNPPFPPTVNSNSLTFQGYKLVALGLAGKARPYNQNWTTQNLSLREDALWYPAVPDVDLCLNEASFIGESPSTAGYRPLCWTLFGGTNGIYLRHLTQVAVTRLGKLVSIEFLYETNGVPDERRKLGRHSLTENSETMRFPIDGPGGEIITMVESSIERIDREGVYSLYKHGKLSSFKVTNNPY